MRITDAMLNKYGYTENCPGCTCRKANVGEVRAHTEECRKRIEEALEGDDEGREIKRRNFERESRRMAEHMEEADQEKITEREPDQGPSETDRKRTETTQNHNRRIRTRDKRKSGKNKRQDRDSDERRKIIRRRREAKRERAGRAP